MNQNQETAYYLTRAQALIVMMLAPAEEAANANAIRSEMVEIILQWHRGIRAPRRIAPRLATILDQFEG